MPQGATRNSEKRIKLLIQNLQFSKLAKNGICDHVVYLHFSDLASGPIWTLGEVSLYPSWPNIFLWPIRSNKNWGFGDLLGDLKKSEYWISIITINIAPKFYFNLWSLIIILFFPNPGFTPTYLSCPVCACSSLCWSISSSHHFSTTTLGWCATTPSPWWSHSSYFSSTSWHRLELIIRGFASSLVRLYF